MLGCVAVCEWGPRGLEGVQRMIELGSSYPLFRSVVGADAVHSCYRTARHPILSVSHFEDRFAHASLAQLVEHALRKRTVVGSIPTGGFALPTSSLSFSVVHI